MTTASKKLRKKIDRAYALGWSPSLRTKIGPSRWLKTKREDRDTIIASSGIKSYRRVVDETYSALHGMAVKLEGVQ